MENPLQLILDMASVHGFYLKLLQEKLGFDVPVPPDVQSAVGGRDRIAQAGEQLSRWLALLDLAISPEMLRDSLKESTRRDAAEALLRYFFRKHSEDDSDRDKADCVVTFLFRISDMPLRPAEQWTTEGPSSFEQDLYTALGLVEAVSLPEEHHQLIREFPFLRRQMEQIKQFDKLMDSGLMQRVRETKQRLGSSFYHPRALANIAEYNVFMSRHFDELFREAARSIKQFAESVQQNGATISSQVEGDVTVKQMAEVQEEAILGKEYGRAQEQLRRISKLKRVVDSRTSASTGASAVRAHPARMPAPAGTTPSEIGRSLDIAIEEGKLRSMLDSIRSFILAGDRKKSATVFPMRYGNLPLSAAEIEAFRAEYRGEKSFRGDYATAVAQAVAINARISVELEEFRQRQYSAYLWKPHADALAFLLRSANRLQEESAAVIRVAQARGLNDKVAALNATLERLRTQCIVVAKSLESVALPKTSA
jgi:hypothetical protein